MRSLTDMAADLDVSTEQVLTTLRVVASRAGLEELAEWSAKELEGYGEKDEDVKELVETIISDS